MAVRLPILDLPSHRYRMTLDNVEVVIRLRYNDRQAAWYLDMYDADEVPIVFGRRLSVGWFPLHGHGIDRRPAGEFYVAHGPELIYVPVSELPALIASTLRVVEAS